MIERFMIEGKENLGLICRGETDMGSMSFRVSLEDLEKLHISPDFFEKVKLEELENKDIPETVMPLDDKHDYILAKFGLLTKGYILNELESDARFTVQEVTDTHVYYEDNEPDGLYEIREAVVNFSEAESPERIKEDTLWDKKVEEYIDIDKFSEFVFNCIDRTAVQTFFKIALIWEEDTSWDDKDDSELYEPDPYSSEVRHALEEEFGDEWAYEIGSDQLGAVWVERNVVVINVSEIAKTAKEISEEPDEYHTFEEIFQDGFIQTAVHEFRHLIFECNPLAENLEELYPESEREEGEVEEYCRLETDFLVSNKSTNKYIGSIFEKGKAKTAVRKKELER
jgi:hypothetical protein